MPARADAQRPEELPEVVVHSAPLLRPEAFVLLARMPPDAIDPRALPAALRGPWLEAATAMARADDLARAAHDAPPDRASAAREASDRAYAELTATLDRVATALEAQRAALGATGWLALGELRWLHAELALSDALAELERRAARGEAPPEPRLDAASAIAAWEEVSRRDPTGAAGRYARYAIGHALEQIGEHERARDMFASIATGTSALAHHASLRAGLLHLESGDDAAAAPLLSLALAASDPAVAETARYQLVWCRWRSGDRAAVVSLVLGGPAAWLHPELGHDVERLAARAIADARAGGAQLVPADAPAAAAARLLAAAAELLASEGHVEWAEALVVQAEARDASAPPVHAARGAIEAHVGAPETAHEWLARFAVACARESQLDVAGALDVDVHADRRRALTVDTYVVASPATPRWDAFEACLRGSAPPPRFRVLRRRYRARVRVD